MTCVSYLTLTDTSTERDLQKVLQQLEPQISFLEELTKMGGAMRTVLTKILTNQQTFKDLSMGNYPHCAPRSFCVNVLEDSCLGQAIDFSILIK